MRRFARPIGIAGLLIALATAPTIAERVILGECGEGYLESIDGHRVIHLRGTPEQMGHQQGVLLGEELSRMYAAIGDFAESEGLPMALLETRIDDIIERQQAYTPDKYLREMEALAGACGLQVQQVRRINFLPELFHCSGLALFGPATADGFLLHGRVLDYTVTAGLQDHALVRIIDPAGGIPWVDVGYTGMIGSVTGMNARGITVGEMGGGGAGQWDGSPMAFLVREALETTESLHQAVGVFEKAARTCEYYYVISDAKIPDARALACTPDTCDVIGPQQTYREIDQPIPGAVLLSAGDRYDLLAQRVQAHHGTIDAEAVIQLIRRPVAMKSNLHDAVFAPTSGDFWVANATSDGEPASEQPYQHYNFHELMEHRPDEAQEE